MLIKLLKKIWQVFAKDRPVAARLPEWNELDAVSLAFRSKKYPVVIKKCRDELARQPGHPLANHFLAKALIEQSLFAEAKPCLLLALDSSPDMAEAHADLSVVLRFEGDVKSAEAHARRAVDLMPSDWGFRLRLADVLEDLGRESEALEQLSYAQEFAPDRVDVLQRLIRKLDQLGKHDIALRVAERARQENGETFDALFFLGYARYVTGDNAGAVDACRKALAIQDKAAGAYVTLGAALMGLGRLDEAASAYGKALRLLPDYADAKLHMGLLNLTRGRFRDGWTGFEARLQMGRRKKRPCEPRWSGSSLRGRVLHVMREQGLGDDIMYSSCYPQLIREARHCVIECEPRLEKIFSRSFPEATFVPVLDNSIEPAAVGREDVDVRIYSASIPGYLRRSVRDFPNHQGYLKADPGRVEFWRHRLAALGRGLKVGISWRGGTVWSHRIRRTMDLALLSPLLKTTGVHWVNLQYGDRKAEIEKLAENGGPIVTDWPEAIDGDYDETAALVMGLDLVVSVCTSVIHLAGALGRPAWVMVPFAAEWRYGVTGEAMPWYPRVRLFRQEGAGDWGGVIARIGTELEALRLSTRA